MNTSFRLSVWEVLKLFPQNLRAFFIAPIFPLLNLPTLDTGNDMYNYYIQKDDVVVDIGARFGTGTKMLSKLSNHVYAFEPNKPSFKVLKSMTKNLPNVDIYNTAISYYDGTGPLKISNEDCISSLVGIKSTAHYNNEQLTEVHTLDSYHFNPPPTVLTLDCEGSEVDVLIGAKKTLDTIRLLLTEGHFILSSGVNTLDACESLLTPLGFKCERIVGTWDRLLRKYESWLVAKKCPS